MIAAMLMMAINIAVIAALFDWNGDVIASDGSGAGRHIVTWLSAILTLYVMARIFTLTREKLIEYAGSGMDAMYKKVSGDAGKVWSNVKANVGKGVGIAAKKLKE
jgi:H+/Cl- antiporter ClcA